MKLAITNREEIKQLRDLLNEIEGIHKYEIMYYDIEDWEIEEEDYPIISEILKSATDNPMDFIKGLFKRISNIHYQRILWNLETLLENCADLELDHLDFKPSIKKHFAFVEKISKIEKGIAPSAGYFQSLIEEAETINAS